MDNDMKLIFIKKGLILAWFLPLLMFACSIPLTPKQQLENDWQVTKGVNTIESYNQFMKSHSSTRYSEQAKIKIRLLKIEKNIEKNWQNLKAGMPLAEVDTLIGPLDEYFILTMKSKMRKVAENEKIPDTAPRLYTYRGGIYTLDFDIYGRLTKWQR
jgi:hypothetical protein